LSVQTVALQIRLPHQVFEYPIVISPQLNKMRYSLLSQASWGRLEMKPKRNNEIYKLLASGSNDKKFHVLEKLILNLESLGWS